MYLENALVYNFLSWLLLVVLILIQFFNRPQYSLIDIYYFENSKAIRYLFLTARMGLKIKLISGKCTGHGSAIVHDIIVNKHNGIITVNFN